MHALLDGVPDVERWGARPEVPELLNLFTPGERPLAGATGWLIESGKLAVRTWLIVVTTNRLFCALKTGTAAIRKVELPLSVIKSAHTDARLGYHEVIVESTAGKIVISGMPKEAAVAVASAIASARVAPPPAPAAAPATSAHAPATAAATPRSEDLTEQVKRLQAELDDTRKRVASIEEILRRAAAKSQARSSESQ